MQVSSGGIRPGRPYVLTSASGASHPDQRAAGPISASLREEG